MSKNVTPPTRNAYFYVEDGAKLGSSCYLEASWGHLGGNLEVQDEAKLGQDEAKLSQVANLSHLGGDSEATWSNMAEKLPTWRQLGWNLAVLRPSWGHLGAILEPLGAVLGPPWGLLGRSWGVLGASRGHLEVTLHCLRRLSSKSAKMQPLPHEMLIFVAKMGPRWGQVGPSWAQVGVKLRS